jgi:poly-beta-1,6-N-acetyl-D-glucosamine N-deacetylase
MAGQLTGAVSRGWASHGKRRLRVIGSVVGAVAVVGLLGVTMVGFVRKSLPYQPPQLRPPAVRLTAGQEPALAAYPAGLRGVPVFAWHDISARRGHLATPAASFAAMLAQMRRDGYHTVRLRTLAALARGERVRLPARPAVLSFDGGLASDWTTVDPILRRYGFTGVAFTDPATVAAKSPSYFLTGDELRAMAASGRWEFGVEVAPARAGRARGELASVAGAAVSAYAQPVRYTAGSGVAAAWHRSAGGFGTVFGPGSIVRADFVVPGSAHRPLPRIRVTPAETPSALGARLRAGAPAGPPANPLTLPWEDLGGTYRVSGRAVVLSAARFGLCVVAANGSQWRDYRLRLRADAPAAVTRLVEVRVSRAGRAEIAIGRSEVTVKQEVGTRWSVLASARVARPGPAALRRGAVRVSVAGRMLRVRAATPAGQVLSVAARLSPRLRHGVIALGFAAGRGSRGGKVAFTGLTVLTRGSR